LDVCTPTAAVFLRVPHLKKLVLCPTRMLQDYFVEEGEGLVEVGQTLWAKVVELDRNNQGLTLESSAERGALLYSVE
jgi:hypothetical protein